MRTIEWVTVAAAVLLVGVPALHAQQCDDFNECTANDMCSGTVCVGTPQTSGGCDDLNPCTIDDRCQPDGGCLGTDAPVGTSCASGCGTCQQLVPVPGVPLVCLGDAGSNGQTCDPGFSPCFEGACQIFPGGAALCVPRAKVCPDTDGNPCTDNCNFTTGQCERTASKCFPDCETCDQGTGQCVPTNIGAGCDDFNVCTSQSRCDSVDLGGVQRGLCQAGAPTTSSPTPTLPPSGGTPTATPPAGGCVGDCNGDGEVTVNELIIGVNIALGSAPASQCTSFDVNSNGMVEVNELIGGVNALLNGCA
jgi:hypothetical protein